MANEQNLKPFQAGDNRAAAAGRKGGIASGVAKREKKQMREVAAALLELPIRKGKAKEDAKSLAEFQGQNVTVQQAILLAMAKKALKGDKAAAEFIRDTAGQKPVDDINLMAQVAPVQIIDDIPDTPEDPQEYERTD